MPSYEPDGRSVQSADNRLIATDHASGAGAASSLWRSGGGFSTFMLFWPPQDAGLDYLFVWGALTSAGYTLAVLPHTAWGAELLTSFDGRARISA